MKTDKEQIITGYESLCLKGSDHADCPLTKDRYNKCPVRKQFLAGVEFARLQYSGKLITSKPMAEQELKEQIAEYLRKQSAAPLYSTWLSKSHHILQLIKDAGWKPPKEIPAKGKIHWAKPIRGW